MPSIRLATRIVSICGSNSTIDAATAAALGPLMRVDAMRETLRLTPGHTDDQLARVRDLFREGRA